MNVTSKDYKIAIVMMWIMSAIFLAIGLLGYFYEPKETFEFGVVVDIASKDIEFNLYRWRNDRRIGNTAKIEKMYTVSCKINVHVDNLRTSDLREQMFRCFRSVTSFVEDFELINSTIFIYGTELTRLMCINEPEKCANVFSLVSDVVTAYEMNLMKDNVKALSGQEEILYGWISVNDYFEKLENIRSSGARFGGIDFKNYSVLLSFEGDTPIVVPDILQNSTQSMVYNNKFTVHGADFMCYGLTQMYNQAILILILKRTWWSSITHPCLKKPYSETIQSSSLFSPCVPRPNFSFKKSYTINGDWDEKECLKLIHETMKSLDDKPDMPMSISLVKDQVDLSKKTFFGFSRISELASLVEFDQFNLQQLHDDVLAICSSSLSLPYDPLCFDILYIDEFVKGLGISPSNVVIGYKEKIETVTGAMVYNSRYIPPRKRARLIGTLTLMHILFTIILFTSLAFYMMQRNKTKKHEKLPSYN